MGLHPLNFFLIYVASLVCLNVYHFWQQQAVLGKGFTHTHPKKIGPEKSYQSAINMPIIKFWHAYLALNQKQTLAHLCVLLRSFAHFCVFLRTSAHFCTLSLLLAHFLSFWYTFSTFDTLCSTFSAFGTLSQLLTHFVDFLSFWHTLQYFLSFWPTWRTTTLNYLTF